jgi:hypothetical protein
VSKCVWLVENDEDPRAFVFFIRGGKRRERERKKRVIEGERETARLREGVNIHVLFAATVRFAQN